MSAFILYLGFHLPVVVTLPPDEPVAYRRDAGPRPGFCVLCKRNRPRTYVRGVHESVCSECINDQIRVLFRVRMPAPPRAVYRAEHLDDSVPVDPAWDRWLP